MSKDLLQIVRDGQHRASNSAASSTARWLGIGALGVAGTGIGATLLLAPSLLHQRDRAPAPAGSKTSPQADILYSPDPAPAPAGSETSPQADILHSPDPAPAPTGSETSPQADILHSPDPAPTGPKHVPAKQVPADPAEVAAAILAHLMCVQIKDGNFEIREVDDALFAELNLEIRKDGHTISVTPSGVAVRAHSAEPAALGE